MTITAKVIADSVHYYGGRPRRVTTFECRLNRTILAELNTHKLLSRNTSSSRAIPIAKMIADVENDPALFVFWGKNQPGMQAAVEMSAEEIEISSAEWLAARDSAVAHARRLLELGLHKQNVNRLLEPWLHVTALVSATDWANFYALRDHKDAQPEFQALARAMRAAHRASTPVDRTTLTGVDAWHLPLVTDDERHEFGEEMALKVSTGRVARVSYLTHDGRRDPEADVELHDRLMKSGHWSPFEHVARPTSVERCGNYAYWQQYRKTIAAEHPYQPGQVEP